MDGYVAELEAELLRYRHFAEITFRYVIPPALPVDNQPANDPAPANPVVPSDVEEALEEAGSPGTGSSAIPDPHVETEAPDLTLDMDDPIEASTLTNPNDANPADDDKDTGSDSTDIPLGTHFWDSL